MGLFLFVCVCSVTGFGSVVITVLSGLLFSDRASLWEGLSPTGERGFPESPGEADTPGCLITVPTVLERRKESPDRRHFKPDVSLGATHETHDSHFFRGFALPNFEILMSKDS